MLELYQWELSQFCDTLAPYNQELVGLFRKIEIVPTDIVLAYCIYCNLIGRHFYNCIFNS